MPSVCFKGFPLGSTVSIDGVMTTSWGQMSEGDSVWDLDPTPGVSVQINARRSNLQAAPEAFQFDLTLSGFDTNTLSDDRAYDPSYHDKCVFWDYGDSYQFTAPEKVQDGNLDSRWSRGPLGAHTYRDGGDFVVRVAVIEPSSGNIGFGTFRIGGASADTPRVRPASEVFEGTATIFVDTNGAAGGYPNAPAGAVRFDNIQAAVEQMPASARATRVVLERGQTHVLTASRNMAMYSTPQGPTSFRIEANTGAGDKPIVTLDAGRFGNGSLLFNDALRAGSAPNAEADIVFAGLDCRGLWDSTTESGAAVTFALAAGAGSSYTLYDDCVFSGWAIAYQSANSDRETMYTINDTAISNWQEYAVFDSSTQVSSAYTGARLTQHVDALGGGPRMSPPRHNTQGPVRFGGPKRAHIWATDIFSRNGWFGQGAVYGVQPCIRFADSASRPGARLNLGASVIESAGPTVTMANGDGNNPDTHVNAVVDGNIMLGGFMSTDMVIVSYGGSTWRNNFLIQPDVQRNNTSIGGFGINANVMFVFRDSGAGIAAGNLQTPSLVYNNTMVNLLSPGNLFGTSGETRPLINENNFSITYENNLVHEPNRAGPRTLYGTVEVSPPDGSLTPVFAFEPRYNGYRDFDTTTTLDQTFRTPADSGRIWVPQAGSPALGAALAEPNAVTSFTGTRRPEPPSVGAAEIE